jgi:hypothetical protein
MNGIPLALDVLAQVRAELAERRERASGEEARRLTGDIQNLDAAAQVVFRHHGTPQAPRVNAG